MFFIAVLLLGYVYLNGWFRVISLPSDSAKTLTIVLLNCTLFLTRLAELIV